MTRTPWLYATALTLTLAGGCVARPTQTPIGTTRAAAGSMTRPDTLVLMFPGYGDAGADYLEHGFVTAMDRAGVDTDVVALDAHYGYYAQRNLLDRVQTDVLEPARQRGYRHVWLVGISMGGLGALLTAQAHDDLVDGVVLLSPFLGRRRVAREIERAGGLHAWTPADDRDDYSTQLWTWLKHNSRPEDGAAVFLGHGEGETGPAFDLLAEALPPEHVARTPGGHTWTTWERVWPQLLDRGGISSR